MTADDARERARELLDAAAVVFLGTNGPDGRPWVKAMLKMENEELERVWFSTNLSSKRAALLRTDGRASVYAADMASFRGLLLLGEAEVHTDRVSRERLWREGFERYYPGGIDDPDYCVVVFTAQRGNYYGALENVWFDV